MPRVLDKTGLVGKIRFLASNLTAVGARACLPRCARLCSPILSQGPQAAATRVHRPRKLQPTPAAVYPTFSTRLIKQLGLKLVKVQDVPCRYSLSSTRQEKRPGENPAAGENAYATWRIVRNTFRINVFALSGGWPPRMSKGGGIMKRLLSGIAIGALMTAGAWTVSAQNERAMHPRIAAAIEAIKDAKAYMQAAPHDFWRAQGGCDQSVGCRDPATKPGAGVSGRSGSAITPRSRLDTHGWPDTARDQLMARTITPMP